MLYIRLSAYDLERIVAMLQFNPVNRKIIAIHCEDLPEHPPVGVRPGADPVQRIAVLRTIPRATGSFAIYRAHFARGLLPYTLLFVKHF
jgi:hypothetical protein